MSAQEKIVGILIGDELPSGWRMSTIGELLQVRNGFAFKSIEYQEDGALLIRQSNLDGSRVNIEKAKYLPKYYLDEYRGFVVKKGDILIGMSGSIGKLCTYDRDEPALQNQRTGLLVFKDPEQRSWVWHYLPLLEKELLKVGKGVAVQNVSASQIESFPIPVAPLDQQKCIVAEIEKQFSRLDEAVANLKRAKANLKRYKAAVLKAAVEGRLVETEAEIAHREGRSYETGEQLLQRILETRRSQWQCKGKYKEPAEPDTTDLPELPEGWVWTLVGQAFDVYVGATPSRAKAEYWNGGIPWVSSGEVGFCRIKSTRETISQDGFENSSTNLHPAGTVLLGMIGEGKTRGQAAILEIEACNNQNSAAIRVSETEVLPEYVYGFLEKEYEVTRRRGSGGNQPALNKERVSQIPIPLPPIAEQQRIITEVDSRLSLVNVVEAQVNANLQRAERLRQTILSKCFSGS